MPASKIVNESEVIRWIEEGRPYQWMVDEYLRKYQISTVPTMFANIRQRSGLTRRLIRDDNLIPWLVKAEHRSAYPLAMLRVEARRRAGKPLRATDQARLRSFKAMLERDDVVVHYDPESEQGFRFVPRRPSDTDIMRAPRTKTTVRPAAD